MCFNTCHENVGKKNLSLWSSRYRGFVLIVQLALKKEIIFFEDKSQHFSGGNKTRSVFFAFVFSIKFKLIKSVVSLRCDFCNFDIGCSNVPVSKKGKFFPLDHLMSNKFKKR